MSVYIQRVASGRTAALKSNQRLDGGGVLVFNMRPFWLGARHHSMTSNLHTLAMHVVWTQQDDVVRQDEVHEELALL